MNAWMTAAIQSIVRNTVYRMLPYSVVSADGWGRFITIQDAIDAAEAGTAPPWICVKKGTYPNPITIADTSGLRLEGGGRQCHITNANDTSSPAVTISGNYNTIEGFGISTEGGGGGGGQVAVLVSGNWNAVRRNFGRDADDDWMSVTGTDNDTSENVVETADGDGISFGAARNSANRNRIDAVGGIGINTDTNADNSQINSNHVDDSITLAAGADNSVAVGNITDEAITDSSTGSTVASNEQY